MMKILCLLVFVFPFVCSGQWDAMLLASQQQASPSAIFDGQNAADPVNEVNGTANTNDNAGAVTITSSAVAPQNGSYALRVQNNGGGSVDGNITCVGVLNGQNVTISFYIKQVTGLAWTVKLLTPDWDAVYTVNPDDGQAGNWELIEITGTAQTNDPDLVIRTTSGGTDGDLADVDNIVITVN